MRKFFSKKQPNDIDIKEVQNVKAFIRKSEAIAGARYAGLEDKNIHFMALPFYETGKKVKNPVTEKDVELTMKLLQEIKYHQVFAAGDFADPHGTHIVCFRIILEAFKRLRKTEEWTKDCWLWMYRGPGRNLKYTKLKWPSHSPLRKFTGKGMRSFSISRKKTGLYPR